MSRSVTSSDFCDALFLFERDGLLLVLEDVAIGAAAALERAVTALVQRLARGQIFERVPQVAVAGHLAHQVHDDFFGAGAFADGGDGVGEFDDQRLVLGRIFRERFVGHRRPCAAVPARCRRPR